MLIKLNFTSGKTWSQVFRILAEIINQPTYTSVAAMQAGATANGWASDLLNAFDAPTSYIYRTKDTTGVVAHIARGAQSSSSVPFDLMLEFPTYDAGSVKQYYRIVSSSTTSAYTFSEQFGNVINSPMSSPQWAISSATSQSAAQGTVINVSGAGTTAGRGLGTSANTVLVYTLWAYITPTSFVWHIIQSPPGFQPSGWHGTNSFYGNQTNSSGSVYSQYKRYDYWNTSTNNILPFVYMNPNLSYFLPFTSAAELGITNPNSATAAECTFYFYNYINATPSTGTTFPVVYAIRGATGIGTRYADTTALTTSTTSTLNATDTCSGAVLNTATVQTRIPSSNLLTKGFSILPLTIRNMNVSMLGGNISDIGDFYLFNGDYFPGDEFSYNNRTFVIFPVGLGYTTRLGFAIPKE